MTLIEGNMDELLSRTHSCVDTTTTAGDVVAALPTPSTATAATRRVKRAFTTAERALQDELEETLQAQKRDDGADDDCCSITDELNQLTTLEDRCREELLEVEGSFTWAGNAGSDRIESSSVTNVDNTGVVASREVYIEDNVTNTTSSATSVDLEFILSGVLREQISGADMRASCCLRRTSSDDGAVTGDSTSEDATVTTCSGSSSPASSNYDGNGNTNSCAASTFHRRRKMESFEVELDSPSNSPTNHGFEDAKSERRGRRRRGSFPSAGCIDSAFLRLLHNLVSVVAGGGGGGENRSNTHWLLVSPFFSRTPAMLAVDTTFDDSFGRGNVYGG